MSRPRALIAEDEIPQRRRLCELLGELWPELEVVAECGDGLAALEALTGQRPRGGLPGHPHARPHGL